MSNAAKRETKTTITGASTVIKRPLAQNDRALTSMVRIQDRGYCDIDSIFRGKCSHTPTWTKQYVVIINWLLCLFKCERLLRLCIWVFQVPASVRIKRESLKPKPKLSLRKPDIAPGFGLMPATNTTGPSVSQRKPVSRTGHGPSMEQKIMDFFEEVKELGAFDELEWRACIIRVV